MDQEKKIRKFEIKPKQFDIFDNIPNTENGKHFGLIYVQYSITYIGTSEA